MEPKRAVYLEANGKQYVLDDEGEKVHGVWYLPPEERIGSDAVVDADEPPASFSLHPLPASCSIVPRKP
jgi:hypothetical protein